MTNGGSSAIMIRRAISSDEAALFDICLRTSDAGGDGTHLYSDQHYPGLIWSVPYLTLCPEHAFALDMNGQVAGYCVATTDTNAFENRLEREWWPRLREMIAGRVPSGSADKGIFEYIRRPERTPEQITALYPAHLHINILPAAQGNGNGGRLLEHQLQALSAAGVNGVHLGINQHNAGVMRFYEMNGFHELGRHPSIIMGRR